MKNMKKNQLNEVKNRLEKEKEALEKELNGFAEKDKNMTGDWDSRFPNFNGGQLEDAADEVEEYSTRLPIEHSLELKLRDVNLALKKIDENAYGVCETCKKEIDLERLEIYPEARFCTKCKK